MKITDVETIELRVGWRNSVVPVHTDAGVTGIAEVDSVPSVIRAIIDAPRSHAHAMGLREALIGQDPLQTEALWERMYNFTSYYGRRGALIRAISAVDIALWDIRSKVADKPASALLGQQHRNQSQTSETVIPVRAARRLADGSSPFETSANF